MEQLLRDGLASLGLPREGVPALLRYAEALVETNKVMNLTAITEPADIATSRAVAALPLLSELCLPLVKPGGWFLAMKAVDSDQELRSAAHAIETLGGQLVRTENYQIPGIDVSHRLVFIKKIKETPKKYPRPFAKIKKNPL